MRLFQIDVFGALFAVASSLMGQTNPGDMVVDVPFTFKVGGQALPPGHYIVAALGDALRISNYQARGIFVPTHAGTRTTSDGSKLVFHRYGDSYFLSAVWVTGNTTGRELFRSPAERELATHKAEMELAIVRPEDSHPSK
jgi:hypothetical protein